ncbi:hypothetical protein HOF92_11780 [bacterium]|jgi:hypothetical protein|nr:hypothetical protein [bacterium]
MPKKPLTDSEETDLISPDEDEAGYFIQMSEHNLKYDEKGNVTPELKDLALCLTSCKWGQGEAGSLLMEHLLVTFAESMVKPRYIILLDSGVYLATNDTPVESLEALTKLEEAGVEIWISETSVSEYKIRKDIHVGRVVKFMEIADLMVTVEKFVNF